MSGDRRQGVIQALGAAVCIGFFSVPWKAANTAGEPAVSALVLLATAAVFSTLVSLAQHRAWPRLRRFDWIVAALLAGLSLAGNHVSAVAIQSISPSVLTVVQRFEAVFVALVAWVFWPRRKKKMEEHGKIPLRKDDECEEH